MAKAKTKAKKTATKAATQVNIKPPNFCIAEFNIEGITPLMQARFSAKAMQAMKEKMMAGSTARSKRTRKARDFDADFEGAMHKSEGGWIGVPAAAFRNACIDVCRMVGFKMTHAKMSIFVLHDGFDVVDGQPLVKLIAGEPERSELAVRNATGVADIRVRPMWREWGLKLRIQYDGDQFTLSDVTNLLMRAGMQVGIGEGRPFSKSSNGLGMGQFRVV